MDISVIIPCYNCSQFISSSIHTLVEYLEGLGLTYEVIVVNDGSSDGTAERLRELQARGVRVLSHQYNIGKYGALKSGFREARGTCCIFIDADLPFDLNAIRRIYELVAIRGYHLVVGDRTLEDSNYDQTVPFIRRVMTNCYRTLVRLIATGEIYDTQCGLKGFRGDVGRELISLVKDVRFAGDLELLYVALKYNLAIRRIPVRVRHGDFAKSSTVKAVRDSCNLLHRLFLLKISWAGGKYSSKILEAFGRDRYWERLN